MDPLDAPDPARSAEVIACARCGTIAPTAPADPRAAGEEPAAGPAHAAPLTWSAEIESGRRRWLCDRCSREHVRSIEGRLDEEWW